MDFINFLSDKVESLRPPGLDAPGFFLGAALLMLLVLILNVVALGPGMAGVVQRRHKWSFAFVGTILSVAIFVVAYIQNVLWW